MPQHRPNGMVFVSYAHQDRDRIEPLVNKLASRFNVWWDRDLEPGDSWRWVLMDQLARARCVIVVWTKASVKSKNVVEEIIRVDQSVIIPVMLDRNVNPPYGFKDLQFVDLTEWAGKSVQDLAKLFHKVNKLVTRHRPKQPPAPIYSSYDQAVRTSLKAAQRLEHLSGEVESIGSLLISGMGPVDDLLGSLKEIHCTYKSVTDAIAQFLAPIGRSGTINIKPYLAMERDTLINKIDNNRGHCTRIFEYYMRVGGIRNWLKTQRLPAKKLKALDTSFQKLSTADGDLFADLAQVGSVLTKEASVIVGFLLTGQQQIAKKRLITDREKLLPLERNLTKAMSKLQNNLSSMGYVPDKIKCNST